MIRIFISLVSIHILAWIVTAVLGWSFDPFSAGTAYHWYAGLWTSMLTLLVHSIVLTYFIGTGRWVREVSDAYGLGQHWNLRSWKAKMRSMPFAMGSMLFVIGAAALGAAADPGATVRLDYWMGWTGAQLHLLAVLAAAGFNLISHAVEFQAIRTNTAVVEGVMHEVQQVRRASNQEHRIPSGVGADERDGN